jgi:hypothetical protein
MISFPKYFVATKYPGYFWNTNDEKLYTMKVAGVLRPLSFVRQNQWNHWRAGYRISVNGQKRFYEISRLKNLKAKNHTIPVWDQLELV